MTEELNQDPNQEGCGPTHYRGCACHEKGWENKWRVAVEMAAQAQADLEIAKRIMVRLLRSHGEKHGRRSVSARADAGLWLAKVGWTDTPEK